MAVTAQLAPLARVTPEQPSAVLPKGATAATVPKVTALPLLLVTVSAHSAEPPGAMDPKSMLAGLIARLTLTTVRVVLALPLACPLASRVTALEPLAPAGTSTRTLAMRELLAGTVTLEPSTTVAGQPLAVEAASVRLIPELPRFWTVNGRMTVEPGTAF